jgi:hypothetical protein
VAAAMISAVISRFGTSSGSKTTEAICSVSQAITA